MPSLQELQKEMYGIMKEIYAVCERHHLRCYLSCGTLLGAVRHQGFIPWDDDIDLEMPWRDYRRFIRYAKKELPENLFVQTFYNDPGYPNIFLMVRKSGTSAMPAAAKDLDIHWGVEVDIFPLVGLYKNKKLRQIQQKQVRHLGKMLFIEYKNHAEPDSMSGDPVYEKYRKYPLKRRILLGRAILFLCTRSRHPKEISLIDSCMDYPVDVKCYDKAVTMKFEDGKYPAPAGYEDVLTMFYGDYMTPPPEDQRGGHDLSMGEIIWDLEKDYSFYK